MAAEKASTALLSRAVTHTVVPSLEVTTRAGLQPAFTVDTTDLAGLASACPMFTTLSVPSDGCGVACRWKLVTYSHCPSGDAVMPTGCWFSGTNPLKSDLLNPCDRARPRLKTAILVVFCIVTNA